MFRTVVKYSKANLRTGSISRSIAGVNSRSNILLRRVPAALAQNASVQQFGFRAFSTEDSEVSSDQSERHSFKAETQQLLDIVTHSLYTDKEVFIRELISNASDALEKVRHLQLMEGSVVDASAPLEIRITADEENGVLTIQDTGVGLSREEMVSNLGTIARSGSKAFLKQIKEQSQAGSSEASAGIIGQFGVGFYSSFMVSDAVTVTSRSATADDADVGNVWKSEGVGSYELTAATAADGASAVEPVPRGCTVVMKLKEDEKRFANAGTVEGIIKKYSNFVGFPIILNGKPVNTVQAIWTRSSKEVNEEEYTEFYKFITNAFDTPRYRLHFAADAPLEIKALFFIGQTHSEKFAGAHMEPGIGLYSRKVLVEHKSPDVLPNWLRFVRGVADSEDLPLSISRERMQDTRLLKKINDVLTRKMLRFLDERSRKDRVDYEKFFVEFGDFLKEGVCTDFQHKDNIAKLLRFDSSAVSRDAAEGERMTSLDEYISRCPPDQSKVYYLCAPDRSLAEASPYYETFKRAGVEVLFLYSPLDDFVMGNLAEFNGRKLVSAEEKGLEMGKDKKDKTSEDGEGDGSEEKGASADEGPLTAEEKEDLVEWLQMELGDVVREVKTTDRLVSSPAIVTEHESAAVRKMMRAVNHAQGGGDGAGLGKQRLEINAAHPIMVALATQRTANPLVAGLVAQQLYDNALVSAGLLDDSRTMVPRINSLLEQVLTGSSGGSGGSD